MRSLSVSSSLAFVSLLAMSSAIVALPSCVPADEAPTLGGVQFNFTASQRTNDGIIADETEDNFAVKFDRVIIGFKTMTIGKVGVTDVCSYRGRGAQANAVFAPKSGVVQAFNGLNQVECPDVGIIFGPPDNLTVLGKDVASKDLIELATGRPAHGLIDISAVREIPSRSPNNPPTKTELKIQIRLDSELTSTRFGGCRAASRGVRIIAGERDEIAVRFAAENLLRDAISTTAAFRVQPFLDADRAGDNDGIATMAELDDYRLSNIFYSDFYTLPDGTRRGSLGDFVRALFRFSILYRTTEGLCIGNEPGAEEEE